MALEVGAPQKGDNVMQKIVELKIEETKAVVGGNRETATTLKPPVVGILPPVVGPNPAAWNPAAATFAG